MKHYALVAVEQEQHTGTTCDGCGDREDDGPGPPFTPVSISVGPGEEGGAVDTWDFCDTCLEKRAPTLKAAGSTALMLDAVPDKPTGHPEGS